MEGRRKERGIMREIFKQISLEQNKMQNSLLILMGIAYSNCKMLLRNPKNRNTIKMENKRTFRYH